MPRPLQALSLLLAALGSGTACAPAGLDTVRADVARGHGHVIDGVPFVAQEAAQCGPAALAMVLRHHGAAVDPAALAQALLLPSVAGVLNVELELQARRLGFRTRAFAGTLEAVRHHLRAGFPLIVLLDPGSGVVAAPHFAVLVGYDDRAGVVLLHSGTTPYRVLSYAQFTRAWAARRSWTLLVTPPGAPA